MANKLTPILLLSFLSGVGFRSFFDVSLKFSWAIFGTFLGFFIIEKITYSLNSFSATQRRLPRVSGIFASLCSGHAKNAEKSVQRTSDFLSVPPLLTKERGFGGEVINYRFYEVNAVALILVLFFLGVIRLSYFEKNIEYDNLHNFYGETKVLEGTILENKITQSSSRIVLKTDEGKILVVSRVYPKYKYGDILKIYGEVLEPKNFGNIDMKKILAKDKIYSEMVFPEIENIGFKPESKISNFLFGIREKFEEKLQSILPEPHSSLANGMILGNEGVLEDNVLDAFKKSGTIHILVLSGYNITILGAALAGIFGFVPAIFGIILFVLMTGAEAPAVRAAIMGIIGILILRSGRPKTAMLILFWSAFFMVMWNPAILKFDRGFQLSFLATLGLSVASGFFRDKFKFLPNFLSIKESAASTLAAQIFVLPLLIHWGSAVSYLSALANIFIVGVTPYIMAFGFLGTTLAFLSEFIGRWVSSAAYLLISFQIYAAKFFAGFDKTFVKFNFLPEFILIFVYALLFYWTYKKYVAEDQKNINNS